ncbi:ubiquitin C-terminal hydrolase Ubp14 [Microbotryomycetes sp. JL201]|nr:ubiquitin C-terminal hydrolase Ubp14 [Microbotryomycetes sp. JL201]
MPLGIDVCLHCFNGSCARGSAHEHGPRHRQKTGHAVFVNVKRNSKDDVAASKRGSQEPPVKRLAIREEPDEKERYEFVTRARIQTDSGDVVDLNQNDKLDVLVAAVLASMSSAQKSEVKAWEEEIVSCQHTTDLAQPAKKTLEPSGLAACAVEGCGLTSNLWLCLACGALGCGRQQFGGGGGNGHALAHTQSTGHAVAVKLGTIEPDGSADVYCYACDDARLDPLLAKHLGNFGIQVEEQRKTEKSMTELQVEQNMNFDFAMTGADGQELQPLYGPGLTGLRNLGNSCYMASSLQSLFSLPTFQERYLTSFLTHPMTCTNSAPATCFECQMSKMADGLLSGRYAVPNPNPPPQPKDHDDKESAPRVAFQEGIRPNMFKSLVGKDHAEFSTMRQQDAGEFLSYLLEQIRRSSKALQTQDPTTIFGFGFEERVQCCECRGVRYKTSDQELLPVPVPVVEKTREADADMQVDEQQTGKPDTGSSDPKQYEEVKLEACLDDLTAPTEIEYKCPSCDKKVKATKTTTFASFPDVLLVNAARFQIDNWVPRKVDVPLIASRDELVLDKYLGKGKQDDEIELPEDREAEASEPQVDVEAMNQLLGMGFPEIRCKKALLATGNSGAEVAMNWLFEHMEDPDIDAPIDSFSGPATSGASDEQVAMMTDMGFTTAQARKALRETNGDANRAVEWLFSHPEDQGLVDYDNVETDTRAESSTKPLPGSKELPAKYRLKAFISHKGPSVHSGHYVAHIRFTGSQPRNVNSLPSNDEDITDTTQTEDDQDESRGRWVLFNDEKVVDAEKGEQGVDKLMPLAYVYVFEKVKVTG